jgi:hypothetical protein
MAFNLDQFRSKLKDGGARPSLFEMELRWPQTVTTGVDAAKASRFMVKMAELPPSTLTPIVVGYFGRKLNVVGDRQFTPLTVTIINDEDFIIRKALEEWMDRMSGVSSAVSQYRGGSSDGGYTTTLSTTQFGRQGDRLRTYDWIGAFPVGLASIPLSWDDADTIETYTCEFQYQWWEVAGDIPTRDAPLVNVDTNVTVG